MKCLNCGKESKWELCRDCKEKKHQAGALISQNKKKLKNLLEKSILVPENYTKFILYTDNIRKRWEIYMGFVSKKKITILKLFCGTCMLASCFITLWSIASLVILHF